MERIIKPLHFASPERLGIAEPIGRGGLEADGLPQVDSSDVLSQTQRVTRIVDVPEAVLERSRVITGRSPDAATNAYKRLRTQVLQLLVAEGWQTVAVVSPSVGEGKTLTAINLSINLATTRSHTTLLVDLDWRRPSVHRHFDYTPVHDVYDYVRGHVELADALVNPSLPRFCFLPCREPVPESSEHLGGLGAFVRELKGRYANRIVLFDLPPLLATDDALSFLPFVDCALLVVEEGRTKRADVVRCLDIIGEDRLLGTVINKSSHNAPKY